MIDNAIKILLIEDNPADALLIDREIKKVLTNPVIKCIELFKDFKELLEEFRTDIILCDYRLNGFTGFEILEHINNFSTFYVPLVFVTGTIEDEELAANSILSGATGYILKKNMNVLHEKLLPHFKKIEKITPPKNKSTTDNIDDKVAELQLYINSINNKRSKNN